MDFLNALKTEVNYTTTENGAVTHRSTMSNCLDLFDVIGALRNRSKDEICKIFFKAYCENKDLAMKILFFARDIRGGLGERRTFRTILRFLANTETESVVKNIPYIQEYGRYDDLLVLLDTPAEKAVLEYIDEMVDVDIMKLYMEKEDANISLIGKWLPSINTSNKEAVANAKKIAKYLGWSEKTYRQTLSSLRKQIKIIENNLREKDYTFDYEKQPSKALFKYRKAFIRNDNERYTQFITKAEDNPSVLKTGSLYPYDIIRPVIRSIIDSRWRHEDASLSETDLRAINATWNALEDFTGCENAIVVRDGSGSMLNGGTPSPLEVATSLAIYFAERNKGPFKNHFITFSSEPHLIKIEGKTIEDKVAYCLTYDDYTNTDLEKVYQLILNAAVKNNLKQEDLPEKIYIISDMEFDKCSNASVTNFVNTKTKFEAFGYKLPKIVFWNVDSRNDQQPVTMNDQGVALVSGCSPQIFKMLQNDLLDPYSFMESVICVERYDAIKA